MNDWGRAIGLGAAGVALGLGLAGAAWIVARAALEGRTPARMVTVKDLAECRAEADIAIWRLPFRG